MAADDHLSPWLQLGPQSHLIFCRVWQLRGPCQLHRLSIFTQNLKHVGWITCSWTDLFGAHFVRQSMNNCKPSDKSDISRVSRVAKPDIFSWLHLFPQPRSEDWKDRWIHSVSLAVVQAWWFLLEAIMYLGLWWRSGYMGPRSCLKSWYFSKQCLNLQPRDGPFHVRTQRKR